MVAHAAARSRGELEKQFREITDRASALLTPFDSALLARRPAPESWSAAECLGHLNITADFYFPLWRQAFDTAPRGAHREPNAFRLDFWGRILVWMLEPPARFKFPAPPNFQPVKTGPTEVLLLGFLDRQRRILELLTEASDIALDRIKITSPFSIRVRYSIWSSFCLTASHERRHLWQAERALKTLGAKF